MKHYTDETVSMVISNLLAQLDAAYGVEMHWYGQTPDWYVCAAMVACDMPDSDNKAATMIKEQSNEYCRQTKS
jgi:hypothetical protein